MILTNKNQKKIVKALKEKLLEYQKNAKPTEYSTTFVPYYDIILSDEEKNKLGEIEMSPFIIDRVKNQTLVKNFIKKDVRN